MRDCRRIATRSIGQYRSSCEPNGDFVFGPAGLSWQQFSALRRLNSVQVTGNAPATLHGPRQRFEVLGLVSPRVYATANFD